MTEIQLQLRFKRNDLWSTVTTHRGTMRILPAKKSRQKVIVGDITGTLHCFGFGKHHDIKPEFTVPPALPAGECTRIALYKDQIFAAIGNRISAYTKKGKPFFLNETNLSEPIRHMQVNTPYLSIGGDYVLTHFEEVTEKCFYICPDKINDMASIARDEEGGIDVYIACQDRTIRCVRRNDLRHQMSCEGPVTAICVNLPKDDDVAPETVTKKSRDLIYGTQNGSVGGLRATVDGLARRFSSGAPTKAGLITAMCCADIGRTGSNDIIVARDDGCIEVRSFERNPDGTPIVAWTGDVSEYLTSLDVGSVTHSDRLEIVVATFSGKLISFSVNDEDADAQAAVPALLQGAPANVAHTLEEILGNAPARSATRPATGDAADSQSIMRAKIEETMTHIADLRRQLQAKKAELTGQDTTSGKRATHEKLRAVAPTFNVKERAHLEEDGTVVIAIEADTPLDCVNIASYVDFEVVQDATANDDVRVSVTKAACSPDSKKSKLLANYKCPTQPSVVRIELKLRPTEGQLGEVHLYITPQSTPRSIQKKIITIPPLSLHLRQAEVDAGTADPIADPTLSTLRITGPFSLKDAHMWMFRGFFDIPQNVTGEECRLTFRNVFSSVMLYVRYRKNDITLYSYNISALATYRDFVTREAASRKIQLSLDARAKPESVAAVLRSLDPLIEAQARLARAGKILGALKELQTQESDVSFLVPEYREILAAADSIERDLAAQPRSLQYLMSVLERLLQDQSTFFMGAAHASPQRVQELRNLLTTNYSLRGLLEFFDRS